MRMSTVREFRDNATTFLRSRSPILITRRGRLAGIFFPRPEASLPVELKKELFPALAGEVARLLRKSRTSEKEVLADFEAWRKARRAARRRC
jgi:hypothetical protein